MSVVDNFIRRQWDFELGAQTLTPIQPLTDRLRVWKELTGKSIQLFIGDLNDYEFLSGVIEAFEPDAVVHFAEQRSAPYSMIDRKHADIYPSQQRRRHAEPALRAQGTPARLPPCQTWHDG